MVMVANARAGRDYEVYDVAGRHLGQVMETDAPPVLGRGAATVLLQRRPEVPRASG